MTKHILTDEELHEIHSIGLRPTSLMREVEAAIIAKIGEPVAWRHRDWTLSCRRPGGGVPGIDWTPLYEHPQPLRELSREEIAELHAKSIADTNAGEAWVWHFAKLVREAK